MVTPNHSFTMFLCFIAPSFVVVYSNTPFFCCTLVLLFYTWLLSLSKLAFPLTFSFLLQVYKLKFKNFEFNLVGKVFSTFVLLLVVFLKYFYVLSKKKLFQFIFHNSYFLVHFLIYFFNLKIFLFFVMIFVYWKKLDIILLFYFGCHDD
jgi:hypothetical protein